MKNKNIDILEHMKTYCEDIESAVSRFGRDKALFDMDRDYRNSVCMSMLQIGELTGHLSEEFKRRTKEVIFWPALKAMRNIFAHNYGAVDIDRVWKTAITDIPSLHSFCVKSIQMFQASEKRDAALVDGLEL